MHDDEMDQFSDVLKRAFKMKEQAWQSTYADQEWDSGDLVDPKKRIDHAWLLREVMHELYKQGEGLDTLLTLKNDELREWWTHELAQIKRDEAKQAAREKAKTLLSDEERKLLGMRF